MTKLIKGADSSSSKFDEEVDCIRSWDERSQLKDNDLVVNIDNMCNLNILYIGSELSGDSHLARILKNHIRNDWLFNMSLVNELRNNIRTLNIKKKSNFVRIFRYSSHN